MQEILNCNLKPWQEIRDILSKLQKTYDIINAEKSCSSINITLGSSKPDYLFKTDSLVKVKFVPEDPESRKNFAMLFIDPICGKIGKARLQIFPSTGTINLSHIDPIGQQLGHEAVSWISNNYHLKKSQETSEENELNIQSLRKQIKNLTMQREKAVITIANLLQLTKGIPKKKAISKAKTMIGVSNVPALSKQNQIKLKNAKKELEKAYSKTRK